MWQHLQNDFSVNQSMRRINSELRKRKASQHITVGVDAYSGAKNPLKCDVSAHWRDQGVWPEVGGGNTESWETIDEVVVDLV